MRQIFSCRRSSIAFISIMTLAFLCYTKGIDVSMAISTVAVGLAGANAYEKKAKNETTKL